MTEFVKNDTRFPRGSNLDVPKLLRDLRELEQNQLHLLALIEDLQTRVTALEAP